jgi:hypothetical protein
MLNRSTANASVKTNFQFAFICSSLLLDIYFDILFVYRQIKEENRVLRRIFGPKRDEVTGEQRKLRNKELHDLYSSPSIMRIMKARRMRWAGHVARIGEKRNAYRLLV